MLTPGYGETPVTDEQIEALLPPIRTPRELGIAAHAEIVRIRPFADGNGRSTRLLADLVFIAAALQRLSGRRSHRGQEDAGGHQAGDQDRDDR
ncbi:Fic family protein [Actinoplanes sp. NPDC000266]